MIPKVKQSQGCLGVQKTHTHTQRELKEFTDTHPLQEIGMAVLPHTHARTHARTHTSVLPL